MTTKNNPITCFMCGGPLAYGQCAACVARAQADRLDSDYCWSCGHAKTPGTTCCPLPEWTD